MKSLQLFDRKPRQLDDGSRSLNKEKPANVCPAGASQRQEIRTIPRPILGTEIFSGNSFGRGFFLLFLSSPLYNEIILGESNLA